MANVSLTWLGHASLRFDSVEGKRVYVDPWVSGPTCPEGERNPERIDVLALTHGHDDHTGDAVELAQKHDPTIVAQVELARWLNAQGVAEDRMIPMNKGGTVEADGLRFTMTNAHHSSSSADGTYTGEPAGFVIEFENGTKVYVAGDTCVFGGMQLIGRLYSPDLAVLPIGDHFTMGPREAALALELLGVGRCLPYHCGTFPLLTGTPAALREAAPGIDVIELDPGASVEL